MNKNKWKSNRGLKIIMVTVSILMAVIAVCSGMATLVMAELGVYQYPKTEALEKHYEHYSEIYTVMAMANRESEMMVEELDQTNFRYGIIKAEDLTKVDISDPASYQYCNFDTMPDKNAIDKEEVTAREIVESEYTRYSWDRSLFGYGFTYDTEKVSEYATYTTTQELPIIGYYYNVVDGIFYYETKEEFYRVDEVYLPVGINGEMIGFQYDSGQKSYYNLNREECSISDYYLTFNRFDEMAGQSWEAWSSVTLDGVEIGHTGIRFINEEYSYMGEIQGKLIADHFYSFEDGTLRVEVEKSGENAQNRQNASRHYWVIYTVREPLQKTGIYDDILGGDLYEQITVILHYAYTWRYMMIAVLILSLTAWVVTTVLVLVMAGHRGSWEIVEAPSALRPGQDNLCEESISESGQESLGQKTEQSVKTERRWIDAVKPGFWQKIPLDVETCVIAFLGALAFAFGIQVSYLGSWWNIVAVVFACAAAYIVSYIWLTDFVVRVKLGKWWRSMLLCRFCVWLGKKLKKAFGFLQENLSFLWKAILILGGISMLEFFGILVTRYAPEAELSIWLLYRFATVALILIGIVQADKLREGAKKLAEGTLQEKIKTQKMFWEFKKHGENLNSIGDGINLAVEKRMQSEHFRTELITNVSHDIKTPLTSIINYVDLLQKEEIDNGKAKEYLEVLSRQSTRLKKLTEDLIEASKASTGSMPVQMEKLELGVFLTQTVGEFEEKLTAAGLHVVMRKPEQEIFVNADGRHLWRVVENLVQNICKYAQPGTRVYIDLDNGEKEAAISFKNISRYELNISGDELMERFVRGDSSRHTDGSGLGLSIAGSLMELMQGKLEIVVDGDLFKVVLHFPR